MDRPPYPSGKAFARAYTLWASVPGVLGALLIVAFFAAVLDLGSDGWRVLGVAIGGQAIAMSGFAQWMQRRIQREVVLAIDDHAAQRLTREQALRAYLAARRLPQSAVHVQIVSFGSSATLCTVAMQLAVPDSTAFTLVVIAVGSLTGGAACLPFCIWAMQRFAATTRDWFAAQLTAAERASHAPPSSLAAKLALPFVATAVATVAFLALLGFSVASNTLEARDVRIKERFLEEVVGTARANPASMRRVAEVARARGVASELALVPLAPGAPPPPSLGLSPRELAWLRSGEEHAASSLGIDSSASFAWATVDPDHALVAASSIESLRGDFGSMFAVVGVVLVGAIAMSLAVAMLVASETRRVAARLREQAERVGAGDFTGCDAIESEDELGAVAHAFALMSEKLGATLSRFASMAAQIEAAAGELSTIGSRVRAVTAVQVEGIERATESVTVVNRQASEITGSTQELVGSVEDASSSALELGAASEQLNQTAIALNAQVDAVASSIDQMVRSVARAGEASEALSGAVVDTNSSVAEMARSMQSVDAHASETARLSTRMIEIADGGRDRVQETMRGMEVIRDVTDAANRTISGLAERMHEIGAIVDVIDEIADETNLLALNAAIIAAQAGDQGRAFSVVADEIKELADRVLLNTKEIGGVIRSVQSESATAAAAIREGAEHVQSGVDLSAQAGVALEEITATARHSGERIQEIVQAMREQTRAVAHVEQLSTGVGERVEQIRTATREQARGNEVVMRGSLVMRDVAQQTQRTTEEQARGSLRIRANIEGVREAVDRIHASLERQNESCKAAALSLREVFERTRSNDDATDALSAAAQALQTQAEALRLDVGTFRLAPMDGRRP